MYRIFGCNGSTSTDAIIDGLARAFTDGAQVLSLSLGGPNGWSEEPSAVVVQRIAAQGGFVSIAAGNDGADGIFDLSSPGVSLGATAVASVDNIDFVTWNAVLGNGSNIVRPPILSLF
jgi:Subtilase family